MSSGGDPDQPFRLPRGGLVDRHHKLGFTFDGRAYVGHSGDTLASALLANGVRLVGRSFKYHRPRGILSAGPEEPNALVELRDGARREPNTRATTTELFDGLVARSQNRWPSLRFDVMAVNSLLSPLLSAGFYYKTFMWPAAFWESVYEPLIRRAAGLGRSAGVEDPDHYEKAIGHCDVLVVGSGPAGLMAALAAGRAGAHVVLCEEDFRLGGRLLTERRTVDERDGREWVSQVEAELAALPEVRIMRRTGVVGAYDGGTYVALERTNDHLATPPAHEPRQRLWHIVARRSVIAVGSIERPIVFGDNDRPGVMLAGAVRTYLNRYGVAPGRRAVVFCNGDDGLTTALDLAAGGIEIAAIVDPRPEAMRGSEQGALVRDTRIIRGGAIAQAHGALGVSAVTVRHASGDTERIDCDLVCMSGGWSPSIFLTTHLGGKPEWRDSISGFVPGRTPPGMAVAGAAAGDFSLAAALDDGARIGLAAAQSCGFAGQQVRPPSVDAEITEVKPLWRVNAARGKAFVDLQNDVTIADVELAQREGFQRIEHLKRYTTLGMATDQGKTSNVNGIALMAELTQRSIAATGSMRARSPSAPVSIGALAGHHRGKDFRPTRLPPSHRWAQEQGAAFVETGLWLRAQFYPQPGERDWLQSVSREVAAVRSGVGVCDVSTLGKIDVQGPDSAAFLDRLYCNAIASLPVGRARYGLMLREDGFVMDDGTVSRIGEHRFIVTTTTANAERVLQHMELCQQWLWPEFDVQFVSVSEQWAQFSVAGPRARDTLRKIIDPEHDISNEAFPYLAVRSLTVMAGIPARLFRISFSGELAYEIAVPAGFGDALVRTLMDAGREFAITPYGTEALGVMRIEKGHVAGNEINGQTTAGDLGLARMLSKRKDYIGRVMAQRPALVNDVRPTLVGLKPIDPGQRLRAGAHFVRADREPTAENDEGYMTSVAFSPTLARWIGLGLLVKGPERHGEHIRAFDPVRDGDVLVEVCDPAFVDPTGELLRG